MRQNSKAEPENKDRSLLIPVIVLLFGLVAVGMDIIISGGR